MPVRLLDPALFWRKLGLLVVFTLLFIPLKAYQLELPLQLYIAFLLLLHVYFVFVFAFRIQWRFLAEHRKPFALRILAVALFVALLARNTVGATFPEFLAFLGVSVAVHTGLLLSLTLTTRPVPATA